MRTVRAPSLSGSALTLCGKTLGRALIVAVYVTLFFGVLPAVLWKIGVNFDRWLALPPPPLAARLLGALGCAFGAWPLGCAMLQLSLRGRGLPISHLPPRRLVAAGLYARARHPIYLAFNVAWAGFALACGSFGAAFGSGLLLGVGWVAYALSLEEPRLRARFGAAYGDYAARAPLCPLPRRLVRGLGCAWLAARPACERLANRTVLFRGRGFSFVTYGAFVALGTFVMALWSGTTLIAQGVAATRFFAFALLLVAAMLLGGRVAGLVYRLPLLRSAPREALRTVAFVSFGGYFAALPATALGADILELPFAAVLDRLIMPGLLCSAIGRLGCLSYGCCGGMPFVHGVRWRSPDARVVRELGAPGSLPRLPTQLLSSAWALAVLALLAWPSTRPLPAGVLCACGAVAYALGRIALETTREETRLGRLGATRGQLLSLAVVLAGLSALLGSGDGAFSAVSAGQASSGALVLALPAAFASALLCAVVTGVHGPRVGRL